MKKLRNLLVIVLMMSLFTYKMYTSDASGIPVGSSNLTYTACLAFSDVFKTIPTSSGGYYYKFCYRATCSNGVYNKANMVSNSGYRCQNGNYDPYLKVSSDGCSKYSGTCSNNYESTYCTKVTYVDCTKKSNGSAFEMSTTTTKRTTRTTKKTTAKKTTAKTTTKAPFTTVTRPKTSTTTKKKTTKTTTKFQPGVIVTSTKSTTTTTTTSTTTTTTTTEKPKNDVRIKKIIVDDDIYVDEASKGKEPISKSELDIRVPSGIKDVDIKVTLNDSKATYNVYGNKEMPDGEGHFIVIEVTAADGVTKGVTKLNVYRYELEDNNCYAYNITSDDVAFEFGKKIMDYEVTIGKSVNSLDLNVFLIDEDKQTYEIFNNEKLKNNSKVDIVIKAEDGTECIYTIKVKKPSNAWKYIILIIVLIAGIVTGAYFFLKYMKKSKGTYKYE